MRLANLFRKPVFWLTLIGFVSISYFLLFKTGNTPSPNQDESGMNIPALPYCMCCSGLQMMGLVGIVSLRKFNYPVAAALFVGIIVVFVTLIIVLIPIYTSGK